MNKAPVLADVWALFMEAIIFSVDGKKIQKGRETKMDKIAISTIFFKKRRTHMKSDVQFNHQNKIKKGLIICVLTIVYQKF